MKIKQEELSSLNTFLDDIKKVKEIIANCELEKRKIQQLKEEAFTKLDKVKTSMDEYLKEITDKYGPININLDDGTYTKVED